MLTGSMVAMVTPMQADGVVDWNALAKLVDYHVEQGTDAIVSVGQRVNRQLLNTMNTER